MNKILIADDNQQITSILANYARTCISFFFRSSVCLPKKCIKVPPTTKAKISSTAAKYSVSFQAILLRMLFLLETVAYAPNGLDLPLLVFKLIHLGPQALDM